MEASVPELTIGQVAELTSLTEPTLRAWERRYGFPQPARGAGGQRRYPADQVDRIRQVVRDRELGVSLDAATSRALEAPARETSTVFAALSARPGVGSFRIPERALSMLVRALEDEVMATGVRPLIIGTFQRESSFRRVERRWHELARAATLTVARAPDFSELRRSGGVLEVPCDPTEPASREWTVVCDSPGCAFALAAWEVVGDGGLNSQRCFELAWTAEAVSVRQAARLAVALTSADAPEVAELAESHLEGEPPSEGPEFRSLARLANRMLAYVVAP